MANFLNVYWWELIQNVPYITATVVALRLWSAGQTVWSLLIGLAGCVVAAAIITLTEPFKLRTTTGQGQPSRELGVAAQIRELLINLLSFAGGTLLVAWYVGRATQFGSLQNHWLADMAVGSVAGAAVAAVQCAGPRLALSLSGARPHILAFMVMGPVVLGLARVLIGLPTLLAALEGSIFLALLMTFIICCVEYGPSLRVS